MYYRFMAAVKTLPHAKAQPLVVLDYEEKFAIAGYIGEEPDEEFVGVARWILDRATNMAEVAFTKPPPTPVGGQPGARCSVHPRRHVFAELSALILRRRDRDIQHHPRPPR